MLVVMWETHCHKATMTRTHKNGDDLGVYYRLWISL